LSKKVVKTIILATLIAVVIISINWWKQNQNFKKTTAQNMPIASAAKGDLEVVLKGSGTLLPMEQETINLKVDGTVKKVYFEEGSVVKKGDLLFELENEELEIGLKKAQLALTQQQFNLEDAYDQKEKAVVYADEDGVVKSINVKSRDSVNSSSILTTIVDQNYTKVRVPFISTQLERISVGQKAEVLLLDALYSVEGRVEKIDNVGTLTSSGAIYYYATIVIDGNHYIEGTDRRVKVCVVSKNGKEQALEEGIVEPYSVVEVRPGISSEIEDIYIDEGDTVKKGQKLFSLKVSDIDSNIEKQTLSFEQAKLDLESKLSQMNNLLIYSGIDGTIIEQNIKEGDLIRPSATSDSNSPAAVIVNYSKMQVVLPIDELDINKVEIGMPVKITAEAVPGEVFQGTVEIIAEQGQSQNNVSTFDVTISTEKIAGLKAGMTVDAELVVAEKQDVLMLPITAIQYKDGKSYVMPTDSTQMTEVKTGISNEEHIEIVSGLKEGDKVLLSNSGTTNTGFGERSGGQMGPVNQMPAGGPPTNGKQNRRE